MFDRWHSPGDHRVFCSCSVSLAEQTAASSAARHCTLSTVSCDCGKAPRRPGAALPLASAETAAAAFLPPDADMDLSADRLQQVLRPFPVSILTGKVKERVRLFQDLREVLIEADCDNKREGEPALPSFDSHHLTLLLFLADEQLPSNSSSSPSCQPFTDTKTDDPNIWSSLPSETF